MLGAVPQTPADAATARAPANTDPAAAALPAPASATGTAAAAASTMTDRRPAGIQTPLSCPTRHHSGELCQSYIGKERKPYDRVTNPAMDLKTRLPRLRTGPPPRTPRMTPGPP